MQHGLNKQSFFLWMMMMMMSSSSAFTFAPQHMQQNKMSLTQVIKMVNYGDDESTKPAKIGWIVSAVPNLSAKVKKEETEKKARDLARIKAEEEAVEQEAELKAKQEAEEVARFKEARIKAEEEAVKHEAEMKAKQEAEEEARIKAEEEAEMKAKQEAEEEAKIKAQEEAELKAKQEAEEEVRIKAEEDAIIKAKEEAGIKAEEETRIKAEEDAIIKAEEETRIKAEEDARIKAEEETRVKAAEDAIINTKEETRINDEKDAIIKAEEEDSIKAADEEPKIKAEDTIQHLDSHGIEYLQSFGGSNSNNPDNGDDNVVQTGSIVELEREVDRLQCENKLLKRAVSDFANRFGDMAASIEEIEIQRNKVLGITAKMDESLCKAVVLFPDEEELSSYEWLVEGSN
eukprot:CAMPEP_0197823470 /NCGR_PEP_ID=MMETSP1437-20131217/823_1 /TAXON_ID=49252 ORGANISM="Eucampia antarctica, Strain CCMP1452" /NCGR_SAMPLE_ID=MMETSP1437 /ASSEMBLY_ACC=CAM_ASM_001096 /LENGTH=401 /DNA_ID=CAMNT_0043422669 /DNA_START=50 /DNA_END=1255 /DNA_ORIENTATION=+